EIENVGIPLGLKSRARIEMLIERGAIEAAEAESIGGEMRGNPIEDHTDAAIVQRIDQVAKIVGGAEARGRREIAGDLITPRARERMLHHRHQLNMSKTEIRNIVTEFMRHLAICEGSI